MRFVKIDDLDTNDTFFHFSRIDSRNSIERDGLQAVAGGENEEVNDRENPTIYFSKGVEGLLKAIDVWIRWEYYRFVKKTDKEIKRGFSGYEEDIMYRVYKKIYEDFKKRQYYSVSLIEGIEFVYGDIDVKKPVSRDENGIPYEGSIWTYGPYSNWENDYQEIWNMNTIIGERVIPKERLKIVENSEGKSDALSVIMEIYEKYRNEFEEDFSILDRFILYAKDRIKTDLDYKSLIDLGRKEPSKEEEEKYRKINKIKTIAPKCRTSLMNAATIHLKSLMQQKEEMLKDNNEKGEKDEER